MRKPRVPVVLLLALGAAAYAYTSLRPATITLTGSCARSRRWR